MLPLIVEIIVHPHVFERLEMEWDQLWQHSAAKSFATSFAWMFNWYKAVACADANSSSFELLIALLRQGDAIVGILPLLRANHSGLNTLSFLSTTQSSPHGVYPEGLDLLLLDKHNPEYRRAYCDAICQLQWDKLYFGITPALSDLCCLAQA